MVGTNAAAEGRSLGTWVPMAAGSQAPGAKAGHHLSHVKSCTGNPSHCCAGFLHHGR